ncbi:hypothetical protein F4680DRAFT_424597 [Xylaria scruposa]|nr:hypothetical protein F4680DRAFT_424597 [Xylaria scruposa]
MRVSTSAAFLALAAAGANAGYISVAVSSGTFEGYQLSVDDTLSFAELVPAAEASGRPTTWFTEPHYYGHVNYYSLDIETNDSRYWITVDSSNDVTSEGPFVLTTESFSVTNTWWQESTGVWRYTGYGKAPFGCINSAGKIQLKIYTDGSKPENCEQVALAWTSAE